MQRPALQLCSPFRWLAGVGCGFLAGTLPGEARAFEALVDASWDAQFYSLRSPFGEPTLSRRRYTSTLGLDVLNLQGSPPRRRGPTLSFRSRFRVDADFGIQGAELDPASNRYVPGLHQAPLDLMYAYFEGRGLAHGLFDFRVGRQYLVDGLGFWSLDGALVTLTLPIPIEISGFAGSEPRTGLSILATSRFTADGVWRGNREDLELRQYTDFLDDAALAPAFGASLATSEPGSLQSRIVYRKVLQKSRVLVTPFFDDVRGFATYAATRTSSERVGYSGSLDLAVAGALSATAVYDLYSQRISDASATWDWSATRGWALGAEVDYTVPTFDGDSIFNWFTRGATSTALGRVELAPASAFDAAASVGARWFETEGDPSASSSSAERGTQRTADVLGFLDARYRFSSASVALQGLAEYGARGHRVGADLTGRKQYGGAGRYDTLVMLSLYDWADALRPTRDATSFSYVLGGGYQPELEPFSGGRLGAEWEHSINRLVGQRFRLLLTLDLTVLQ